LDLDHDPTPNRATDIDWGLFYTFDDLGLLTTKGTDYEPSDAVPSSQSFKHLEGLSDIQRADLAHSLLDQYSLTELFQHDHIIQFFLKLEDLPDDEHHRLIERFVDSAPISTKTIENSKEAFVNYIDYFGESDAEEYNQILLALVIHFAYNAWRDSEVFNEMRTANEGGLVWISDEWVVFAGSELMFYSVSNFFFEALPDSFETVVIEGTNSRGTRIYDVLEAEVSSLCAAQAIANIREQNWALAEIFDEGFKSSLASHCLILPRPSNHDSDTTKEALNEAEEIEGRYRVDAIKEMFEEAKRESS
jgi:hypothetical protein